MLKKTAKKNASKKKTYMVTETGLVENEEAEVEDDGRRSHIYHQAGNSFQE